MVGIFHWFNPSDRTLALESTQPVTKMSTRVISWWCKGGRCVGLVTLPPSCADCVEIPRTSTSWSPEGLSRPAQGLLYLRISHWEARRIAETPYCTVLCCHAFIHLVVCLTTGPKPLPKPALHTVRSRASSFKWEYLLLSSSAWGHLKPSSYCGVGRFFYKVFKFWAKLCRSLFKIM